MATVRNTDAPFTGAPAVHSLHVLTVNTHKGFTALNRRFILPELREAVREASADVVFLQEVLGAHKGHARRFSNWPQVPQYEFLAESMWPQFAYGRNALYPEGEHGNALLSKYPIREHANYDVSLSGTEKRGLLYAILDVPGPHAVHVICVHLGLAEDHRRRQLHLLCELLGGIDDAAPVIVAGDFNDWRLRADAKLQTQAMGEVFTAAYGKPARSFPAFWPLLRLDRIYLRNAMAKAPGVLSLRPWSHLSDHVPLAVEVLL